MTRIVTAESTINKGKRVKEFEGRKFQNENSVEIEKGQKLNRFKSSFRTSALIIWKGFK
jgi:hypothetical protein